MLNKLLPLILLLFNFSALANWQLNNENSRISFVSVKKNTIGEVHHFKQANGEIKADGKLTIAIDLSSVETHIPIRNERMQSMLFNTKAFPKLLIKAQVNKALSELAQGQAKSFTIPALVSLNGINKEFNIEVFAAHTQQDSLLVTTMSPVIINAADFNLAAGVNALQKVAGLPSIAQAVPVTFVLHFVK